MKKIKITALGLATLITGVSAFTAKHEANNKFKQTYYVLATSYTLFGTVTVYQITTTIKRCSVGPSACSVHITTIGSTVMTIHSDTLRTWLNKTNVVTLSTKS